MVTSISDLLSSMHIRLCDSASKVKGLLFLAAYESNVALTKVLFFFKKISLEDVKLSSLSTLDALRSGVSQLSDLAVELSVYLDTIYLRCKYAPTWEDFFGELYLFSYKLCSGLLLSLRSITGLRFVAVDGEFFTSRLDHEILAEQFLGSRSPLATTATFLSDANPVAAYFSTTPAMGAEGGLLNL